MDPLQTTASLSSSLFSPPVDPVSLLFPEINDSSVIKFLCERLAILGQQHPACGDTRTTTLQTITTSAFLVSGASTTKTTTTAALTNVDWFLEDTSVTFANKAILSVLFGMVLIIALGGNLLVLLTVAFNRAMWTSMHFFIVSLAFSDVFSSVICIPLNLAQALTTDWTLGTGMCKMAPFFMQVSVTASALTLCCMAAERYLAIVYPLKFSSFHTKERALVLLCIVWAISLAAAIPYPYFYDTDAVCGTVILDDTPCQPEALHTICRLRLATYDDASKYYWLSFLVLFILPAVILTVAYAIIIYKLWVKTPVGFVLNDAGVRTRYKKRAVKMLVLVVVLFFICWAPLMLFTCITMEDHRIQVTSGLIQLKFYLQCLALSSTVYNPIVYAFLNPKFRLNFKNLLLGNRGRVAPMGTTADPNNAQTRQNNGHQMTTFSQAPGDKSTTTEQTRDNLFVVHVKDV